MVVVDVASGGGDMAMMVATGVTLPVVAIRLTVVGNVGGHWCSGGDVTTWSSLSVAVVAM
jgi:hypothetical protein